MGYEIAYARQYSTKLEAQEEFLRWVDVLAPYTQFQSHNKFITFGGEGCESYFYNGAMNNYSRIRIANWDKKSWTVSQEVGIIRTYHSGCKVPHWIRKLFNDNEVNHE